jgi:hypothetical protein
LFPEASLTAGRLTVAATLVTLSGTWRATECMMSAAARRSVYRTLNEMPTPVDASAQFLMTTCVVVGLTNRRCLYMVLSAI